MAGHDAPESPVTFVRNQRSRCSGIPKFAKTYLDVTIQGTKDIQKLPIEKGLALSSIDQFRFMASYKSGITLVSIFSQKKEFVKRFRSEIEYLPRLSSLVQDWQGFLRKHFAAEVIGYEQHGDLNPRNILVRNRGDNYSIKLIDFARFGVWPAFYDLRRLRLQLAFRLLDPPGSMTDQLENRILVWDMVWREGKWPHHIARHSREKAAISLSKAFVKMRDTLASIESAATKEFSEDVRREMDVAAMAAELVDLVKMASYQDASWVRRVWFLLLASRCAKAIEAS